MATDVSKVLDQLGKMTVLELVELKKSIEEEWGVTAAAPVAVAAAGAAGGDGAAAAEEEKDSFDVVLTSTGDKKIQVIKVVRAVTGARAQGGEGPRGRRPRHRQGGRPEGGGRRHQGSARRGRSRRRAQVAEHDRRGCERAGAAGRPGPSSFQRSAAVHAAGPGVQVGAVARDVTQRPSFQVLLSTANVPAHGPLPHTGTVIRIARSGHEPVNVTAARLSEREVHPGPRSCHEAETSGQSAAGGLRPHAQRPGA